MSQQILYVAIGPQYLAMALRAAAGAQAAGFAGSVMIVTDQPNPGANAAGSLPNTTFAAVATPAAPPFGALDYKTRFLDFATADQVLFLDADILVKADVTPIFLATGIAMVPEIYPSPAASGFAGDADFPITQQAGLDQVPFWNTGVLALGNDATGKALMAAWHAEWQKFSGWDELSMLRALKSQGVTPVALDPKWNDLSLPPKTGSIQHWFGGQKLLPEFQAGL